MLKIGIVEDNTIVARLICKTLEKLGYEYIQPVSTFEDGVRLVKAEKPDLLLIDVNLDGLKDGIDLGAYLNENYPVPFIFITSDNERENLERAKKTNPSAYLLKPIKQDDLFTSIEIAITNHKSRTGQSTDNLAIKDALFVKDGYSYHKVLFKDIVYLESEHIYVNLYTSDLKKHTIRTSMLDYLQHFDQNRFYRVHRSYIINLDYIQDIRTSCVKVNGIEIPISKNHREDLLVRLKVS